MKISTVQIPYESKKLRVLRQYMMVEGRLQACLEASLQVLYEKHVPAEVREAIARQEEGGTP